MRGADANVADLVAEAAAAHAARPAVVEPRGGPSVTWAALEQRTATTAAALPDPPPSGRPVAVVLPNSVAFAVAAYAVLRAGRTLVPINPAYTPRELAHLLADSGASTALVHPTLAARVAGAATQAGTAVAVVPVADLGLAGTGRVDARDRDPAPVAVLGYTSGTTGKPKGALLHHSHLLANLGDFCGLPRLTLDAGDVLYGVVPFFHLFGLNVVLDAAARHGACVVAVDRFSPTGSLATLAEHRVTVAYGAPPVFAAWSAVPDVPALPSLRAAVSGADTLPVPTWERFAARFGLEILEGYGLTETAPVLASNVAAPATRPGTVGHALPSVSLRIAAPDGTTVPAGTVGEILAAGPNVFAGYHGLPEATAEVCRDGWFHTGDLGSVGQDGYLTIAGRLKDLVIVSGFNVYPREVEDVLVEHPWVADAAVIGVPDERTGERVRAVVVPRAGALVDEAVLAEHCRARLARYKLPREYAIVGALPRLATGKIDRAALRATAGGG